MIIRRPDEVVDEEAMEEIDVEEYEEYIDTSERLELVRVSCTSEVPSSSGLTEESRERRPLLDRLTSRLLGGTNWTWRFKGWLDFEGGGRTTMNDCRCCQNCEAKVQHEDLQNRRYETNTTMRNSTRRQAECRRSVQLGIVMQCR